METGNFAQFWTTLAKDSLDWLDFRGKLRGTALEWFVLSLLLSTTFESEVNSSNPFARSISTSGLA